MWFNPPTRSASPDAGLEAQELECAEAAVVAAAPAHLQEAAAELAPLAAAAEERRRRGSGLRHRVIHNFSWFTAAVAAVFAVGAGAGMVLSGTDVGIVAALQTGGHQAEIGIVFLFWCAASVVGGILYGAMHRPVSPILLLLGMSALTVPMAFATDIWTLSLLVVAAGSAVRAGVVRGLGKGGRTGG